MKSNMLTWPMGRALFKALHPATVADGTRALGDLLLVKSEAEMVYMREAGRYAEIGRAATRAALRPGITEIELAAALEGSMRGAGSDYWSIPTELSSGPRTPGGHATPRERPIEPGDLVHIEYAGASHRYHTVVCHTMALGDPGPRAREVYDVARASLRAGMDAIRPGVPVAEVEDASFEPVRQAGLMEHCLWRYGYGIGISYPPIWLGTLQISEGFDHRMEVGMTFTLHAWLGLNDENIGLLLGGSYLLTDDGLEQLCGGGDVELDVVPV
jgi:Xaa-Pro aminopeptidase